MKVLVTLPLTDAQADRVRDAAGDAAVVLAADRGEQRREIQDADVLFGHMTPELLEFAPHVQWVQQTGAGVDSSLFPAFVESDILLTSEKGYVGNHLADHAMALLLSLARGIAWAIREPTWDNRMPIRAVSWELSDKTMGIVGLGGTGRAVAQRALGFDMRVLAVDPEPVELPPGVEACWPMDQFHRLLGESDTVVICAPLTAETHGMFDRAAFRAMRRHAILVSVTRGKIVDEAALMAALTRGPDRRRRARRHTARAAAGRSSAVEHEQRGDYPPHRRRLSAPPGPRRRPLLPQPAPLPRRRATREHH